MLIYNKRLVGNQSNISQNIRSISRIWYSSFSWFPNSKTRIYFVTTVSWLIWQWRNQEPHFRINLLVENTLSNLNNLPLLWKTFSVTQWKLSIIWFCVLSLLISHVQLRGAMWISRFKQGGKNVFSKNREMPGDTDVFCKQNHSSHTSVSDSVLTYALGKIYHSMNEHLNFFKVTNIVHKSHTTHYFSIECESHSAQIC